MLSNLNDIQFELDTAAGAALAVEIRMRLIGQLSPQIQEKLKDLVKAHVLTFKKPPKNLPSDKYWDCNLSFLDQAIDEIFQNELKPFEREQIKKFRTLRNKLLHADFINLMIKMKISPTGRQIISTGGDRNILDNTDIKESILSIKRNQGFSKFRIQAKGVISILDQILHGLATK